MRQTSLDAWKRINEEGLVGPFQLEVYNIIYKLGPMTAGEAWDYYRRAHSGTHRGRNEVAKRVYELCKTNVVQDTGQTKPCPVTGFDATVWDVTSSLPKKVPEKEKRGPCPHCSGTGYAQEKRTEVRSLRFDGNQAVLF